MDMAILIQCPDCREKYTFEDAHGGKSLACKCGRKLEIPPAAADGSDVKQCPFCGNMGAADRVICVGCGYNFNTGKKLKTSGGEEAVEETPSIISKLIPIIKLVVVPILILAFAYFIYSSFTGKNYGISKSSPLGTFQKIEKELTGSQILKSPDTRPIPKGFGVEGKIYTFVDENLKKASKGFTVESISCAVDSQNRVVGVAATFFPPGEGIPTLGTRVYLRMLAYWQKEMEFGKNPKFASKRLGEGKFSYEVETAVEKNETVQSKWIKEPGPTALQGSSDTMIFALNEYNIDCLNPEAERSSFMKIPGLSGLGIKTGAGKVKADKDDEE